MNGVRFRIVLSFWVSTLRQNRRGGTPSAEIRQKAWRVGNWTHTRAQPEDNSPQNVTLIKDLTGVAPSTVLQVLLVQPIHSTLFYNTQPTKRTVFFVRLHLYKNVKVQSTPRTGHERPHGGVDVLLYSFFDLGARWGGWSTLRPARFTPGKDSVPILQEAGWAPPGFDPRTVQPVASRYTDWAIPTHGLYL